MQIAVVSLAEGMPRIRGLTFPNKQAWCQRHGYEWMPAIKRLDGSRPAAWSKIAMMADLCNLRPGAWAMWMDADTAITRPEFQIESIIDESAGMVIGKDHNGINSGVFLMRMCPASLQFLNDVYAQTQFIDHRWWEQAAMTHLINRGHAFPIKYIDMTLINATPDNYRPGHSAVIHVTNDKTRWPDRVGELRKWMELDCHHSQHREDN